MNYNVYYIELIVMILLNHYHLKHGMIKMKYNLNNIDRKHKNV